VLRFDICQTVDNVFKRCLPINLFPFAALLEHRLCQSVCTVQRFVRKTVSVGYPAFIHRFVFERDHAHDTVVFDLNHQIRASGIMRTDRTAPRHFPRACAVAEWLAGQSANRANINHVARQLGIDGFADECLDFRVLAAMGHAKLHRAGNFLSKANAPCAVNATAHLFHRHQWTHVLVGHHAFLFFVSRGTSAVAHRQVLQLALAALIADRAVEGVVDQQKLHHRLLGFDRLVGLRSHDHALCDRCRASRHWLGCFFYLNQAHTAAGSDGQLLVIAEMRHVNARLFGCVHDHATRRHFYFFAVKFDFNHGVSRIQAAWDAGASTLIMRSNSGRKCLIMARTGMAAASPSAQIVRPMMFSATLSRRSMSAARPSPL